MIVDSFGTQIITPAKAASWKALITLLSHFGGARWRDPFALKVSSPLVTDWRMVIQPEPRNRQPLGAGSPRNRNN
jgi:hypothetical protein